MKLNLPTRRIGVGILAVSVLAMFVGAFDLLQPDAERWLAVAVAGGLVIAWARDGRPTGWMRGNLSGWSVLLFALIAGVAFWVLSLLA